MSDLRAAAQQALEALKMMRDEYEEYACPACDHADAAIHALRAALAEPQIDPVDEYRKGFIAGQIDMRDREQAEPVQEPVAKVELMTTGGNAGLATRIVEIDDHLRERLRPGQLLYTTPHQRKPLTEEEIIDLWEGVSDPESPEISMIDFARAIERAHGING